MEKEEEEKKKEGDAEGVQVDDAINKDKDEVKSAPQQQQQQQNHVGNGQAAQPLSNRISTLAVNGSGGNSQPGVRLVRVTFTRCDTKHKGTVLFKVLV